MKQYEFTISLPPSANSLFTQASNHYHRIITPEYKQWRIRAAIELMEQKFMKDLDLEQLSEKQPWGLTAHVKLTKAKFNKSDLDNRIKPIIDLFSKRIGIDDRYLTFLNFQKVLSEANEIRGWLSIIDA